MSSVETSVPVPSIAPSQAVVLRTVTVSTVTPQPIPSQAVPRNPYMAIVRVSNA